MPKKLISTIFLLVFAICVFVFGANANAGGTNYVLMGLTVVDGGEGPDYYELIKGATTIPVPTTQGIVVGESGVNKLVLFPMSALRALAPTSWSVLDMADWLSQADGFVAFDWRMLGVYATTALTIQNRAYTYEQVRDIVYQYEWWAKVDDEWVKSTGTKAEYIANGYPSKLVRVVPMTKFFGVNE